MEYSHQKFIINHDNTISLKSNPNLFLGSKNDKIYLVEKSSKSILIFDKIYK